MAKVIMAGKSSYLPDEVRKQSMLDELDDAIAYQRSKKKKASPAKKKTAKKKKKAKKKKGSGNYTKKAQGFFNWAADVADNMNDQFGF